MEMIYIQLFFRFLYSTYYIHTPLASSHSIADLSTAVSRLDLLIFSYDSSQIISIILISSYANGFTYFTHMYYFYF